MINKNLIIVDQSVSDKAEALAYMIDAAKNEGVIGDTQLFLDAVMERENMESTALGFSIAIPHGKSDTVEEPFVIFMRTKEKIVWNDGEEAIDLIFLMGLPKEGSEREHLVFLSSISRKLVDEDFRHNLNTMHSKEDVYELLSVVNQ